MKQQKLIFAVFALLMFGLGISDSLRGVFSPVFAREFSLSASQLSLMVTASYVGNLVFLLLGGRMMDRLPRKKGMLAALFLWMAAMALFAFTRSYSLIVVGSFFALGASTLLNTTMNLLTPFLWAASPAMMVNLLFFIQGVGTSGSQSVLGNWAKGFSQWRVVTLSLLGLGAVAALLLLPCALPENPHKKEKTALRAPMRNKAFWPLVLVFSTYFVAEHGVMNWFVAYGTGGLQIEQGSAANYVALFFGGITLGRLVLGRLVDKLGVYKSVLVFGGAAAIVYAAGTAGGVQTLAVFSASGLLMAVLYPTFVMLIARLWPRAMAGTASGLILSIASLADILFNAGFGFMTDALGYRLSFWVMPLAMAANFVLCVAFRKTLCPPDEGVQKAGRA